MKKSTLFLSLVLGLLSLTAGADSYRPYYSTQAPKSSNPQASLNEVLRYHQSTGNKAVGDRLVLKLGSSSACGEFKSNQRELNVVQASTQKPMQAAHAHQSQAGEVYFMPSNVTALTKDLENREQIDLQRFCGIFKQLAKHQKEVYLIKHRASNSPAQLDIVFEESDSSIGMITLYRK
jgi:hypothetical protein